MNKKIAITAGDFNGIGPEVIIKALNKLMLPEDSVVLIGAKPIFTGLKIDYEIKEIPYDIKNQEYGKETISAIVTAPVSKNAMHLAGHNFSGQTEVLEYELADKNKNEKAEMVFVSNDLRILLLTRHLPLKEVKITQKKKKEKVERINRVLKNNFKINCPKIALCSLNPHAGESGILGLDEIEEFTPAVEYLRGSGIDVSVPMPADTLFAKAAKAYTKGEKQPYDMYCACYHDQGLIPIKVLAMDNTVNMTAGLSVIRTSPAHGTAYDIAGKGVAGENSMICVIKQALL